MICFLVKSGASGGNQTDEEEGSTRETGGRKGKEEICWAKGRGKDVLDRGEKERRVKYDRRLVG